jgi:cardiolipin synthase A/B
VNRGHILVLLKLLVLVPLAVVVLVFSAIGFLASIPRTTVQAVRAVGEDRLIALDDEEFTRTLELHTGAVVDEGNDATILLNGDATFPALWQDLRSARTSITVQVYSCTSGTVADTLTSILLERAAAGVRVLFLPDDFGCKLAREAQALRAGGVFVAPFRPVRWDLLHNSQKRAHSRIVVVDGVVGFTGGFGIEDKWLGDGRTPPRWRETNVRFTGPAVARHQAVFAAAWAEATGQLLTGDAFFPRDGAPAPVAPLSEARPPTAGAADTERAGAPAARNAPDLPRPAAPDTGSSPPAARAAPDTAAIPVVSVQDQVPGARAALLHTVPAAGSSPLERFYALAVAGATRRLWITNSYFVPDASLRRLLIDAARRGVDVRVLTADEQTDLPSVRYAGRATYHELLEGGVRIFEYAATALHAKTLVADGLWSGVGSANFDNRSIAMNVETVLVVRDEQFADSLEGIFLDDLTRSREILLEEFRRRGLYQRARERISHLVSAWL